jgi:hypothetical protein
MVSNFPPSSAGRETPIPDTVSYRVELLTDTRPTATGIAYRCGSRSLEIGWSRVKHVVAAEVGEPQGVRTIVFDLVLEAGDEDWVVCRFDADPSEDAMEVARAIAGALPDDRVGGSIKSLATDGIASRWYPDLESFEEANRRAIP